MRTHQNGPVAFAHARLVDTPESLHEVQPLVSRHGDRLLVCNLRLDNRDELLRQLDPAFERDTVSDAALVLAAYERWGEQCVDHLLGDFVFAVWDGDEGTLLCARDPMGVKPLYYTCLPTGIVFASELATILKLPGVSHDIDWERVESHLFLRVEDTESTFYRHVRRLPPAHRLVVSADKLRLDRYWQLDPSRELRLGNDDEYVEAFRETFFEAVRCRLRSHRAVGSTLSGGLDSSSICSTARQIRGESEPLHTFSLVFPDLEERQLRVIDERPFMDAVLTQGGFLPHPVRASALGPLDDLEELCAQLASPLVPFNLYLHLGMYREAQRHHVGVLLDGFDGDTTVSYGFDRLAELAATLHWPTLLHEIRALQALAPNPLGTWRLLWDYALRPLVPPSARRTWRRLRRYEEPTPAAMRYVAGSFLERAGAGAPAHRAAPPLEGFRTAREQHYEGLTSPLLPTALEIADVVAGSLGIDVRYPYFDRRLVELCLALPSHLKLRDGWGRWIFRRAMAGVLPPDVQWRPDKADLSPNFDRGLRADDGATLSLLLEQSEPALAGLVEVPEVKRSLYEYLEGGPTAAGAYLFTIVTTGLWLREQSKKPEIPGLDSRG